jgi:alkylation response protein AidB-like acyl-CoA dehydrogenase
LQQWLRHRFSVRAVSGFGAKRDAAERLIPLIEAEAEESERAQRQSDKVVAELRKAGLYAMLLPRELGGGELDFVDAMRIVERLAWADGSAGWCAMVAGVMAASAGSFLTDKGAQTAYGKGSDVTLAGNGVPRSHARRVDGGYRIKGHWAYGSGITHAEWVHSGCFIVDGDGKPVLNPDGSPEIVLMHHPKDTIELKGNWDVLGLRGTGSFDYVQKGEEVFVPEATTYSFDAETPQRGGAQYRIGLVGFTAWGHTSWALGVGRRALDEIARLARERSDVFGLLADSATFRKGFAEAEAKYRSARAFVYESWTGIADTAAQGLAPTLEQIALIRLAMRHSHDVLSEITTFAHRASRGVSLRLSRLQRAYRDAHAGTQHLLLADEIELECARVLLGVTKPGSRWTMFAIRD